MTHFDDLTPAQQILLTDAEQAEDAADYLRNHPTASAADKAVVAELLGGPDAGQEFLR